MVKQAMAAVGHGWGMGWVLAVCAGIALAMFPLYSLASNPTNIAININGTVTANAHCSFGSDDPIVVDFGDVYVSDLAAGGYRKEVPYTLTCKGEQKPDGRLVEMRFVGTRASFDDTALATNVRGLGIKIMLDGTTLSPGSWIAIDPNRPPKIEALVMKGANVTFYNGQKFTASITLTVDYV
ncbi:MULTISPECIES: fimbrial protein [Edwardsiella]|nr:MULTISPECIES: fimbrial protein [Edwardsiella]AKR78232.2 fimbrial protein [Edwardsiella sp. LADL05-105]UOU77931.1 fimbrial protein [Edwardsiella anguillarum]WHP79145.1 fimbrial protein [Edwardsiella anguillarum]WHP82646.1 fimbrial protein [Edwardsiella anguillarum]WHP86444.1 fimbrial protein [Edwardsiella anguillarum]